MNYRVLPPGAALERFVSCYWILESSCRPPPQTVFPDGCIEIVIQFGDPFLELRQDGSRERQPESILVGQMLRPTIVAPQGRVGSFGIRFRPGGAWPFLRFPQQEAEGRILALDEAWGSGAGALRERIGEAATDRARVAVVEEILQARLGAVRRSPEVAAALARIQSSGGGAPVRQLAADLNVSWRGLDRAFAREVGVTPKAFARVVRFQNALQQLSRAPVPWAQLAVDCGYYDQAHFIRDFRMFSGSTPGLFLGNGSEMARSFAGV